MLRIFPAIPFYRMFSPSAQESMQIASLLNKVSPKKGICSAECRMPLVDIDGITHMIRFI